MGLARTPTSGRAPPEGALDLRVSRTGRPRVGAGTGGLVHSGVCAGDHGKGRAPAFPKSAQNSRVRFSNGLAQNNQVQGLKKAILVILNLHISHMCQTL